MSEKRGYRGLPGKTILECVSNIDGCDEHQRNCSQLVREFGRKEKMDGQWHNAQYDPGLDRQTI